jgi:hypothetical protein
MPLDEDFAIWVSDEPRGPGQLGFTGAMLKSGPQVAKSVTLATYGDANTGTVSKRELCFRTSRRLGNGLGYDFANPERRWACENEEIEKLLAFLNSDVAASGRYKVIDTDSPLASLLDLLSGTQVDVREFVSALEGRPDLSEVVSALATTTVGLAAAEGAVIEKRRRLIATLRDLAEDPSTTETDLHRAIGSAYWLFGGRYVGLADRRSFTALDQYDIPLLEANGTIHIVELKGTNIPKLIYKHRSHYVVGKEVHEATSQAINYLRTLDESGAVISTTWKNEFGVEYDMRRVFATVVIGYPDRVDADMPDVERVVDQTIRSYNAHLSRVEVLTYKSLLDAAERALQFEETARTKRGISES